LIFEVFYVIIQPMKRRLQILVALALLAFLPILSVSAKPVMAKKRFPVVPGAGLRQKDVVTDFFCRQGGRGIVNCEWETWTEGGVIGFNLYRFNEANTKRVTVSRGLVRPKGRFGGLMGARYKFTDTGLKPGCYYYRLEVVSNHATILRWKGPVRVRVIF
jgi:hypothetical protein